MSLIRLPTMSPMPTRAHLRVNTTSTAQTFTNNVSAVVGNWTVQVDTHNGFSGGNTYTTPTAGLYMISAGLRMSSATFAAGSIFLIQIVTAAQTFSCVSSTYPAGASFGNFPTITATAQLNAGSTIQIVALQASGTNLTLDGALADNWWTVTQLI